MTTKPNTLVAANVMVPRDVKSDLHSLAGDFAVKVYGQQWLTPQGIRKSLSARQIVEYEQYLVCFLCGRPCAGTCGLDRQQQS